jgi:hypothetical protein
VRRRNAGRLSDALTEPMERTRSRWLRDERTSLCGKTVPNKSKAPSGRTRAGPPPNAEFATH